MVRTSRLGQLGIPRMTWVHPKGPGGQEHKAKRMRGSLSGPRCLGPMLGPWLNAGESEQGIMGA